METLADLLLHGPFPEIRKMSKKDLQTEVAMWRKVWQWIPDEVKYYVARTGMTVGITMRNYKRYLGTLLETHWDITEIELGVADVVYDTISGERFFEKKRLRTKLGGVIDIQWIHERKSETEIEAEQTQEQEQTNNNTIQQ